MKHSLIFLNRRVSFAERSISSSPRRESIIMKLMYRSANMNKLSNKWCTKKKSSCLVSSCADYLFFPRPLIKRLATISSHYERLLTEASPPTPPVLYSWSWAARCRAARPPGQGEASNCVTRTGELREEEQNKDKRLESTRSDAWPWWLRCLCCLHAFHTPLLLLHSKWFILWLSRFPNPECVTLFHPQDKITHPGKFIQSSEIFFSRLLHLYLFVTETHECAESPVEIERTVDSYANPPQPTYEMWTQREPLPIMPLPSVHLLAWNTQL